MNASKVPITLTGPYTHTSRSFRLGESSVTIGPMSVPLRVAFAVIAATHAKRANSVWPDDFAVPRCRIGRATAMDPGRSWEVQRRATSHLVGLGLVRVVARSLGATKIYDHAVLTPLGIALASQIAQVQMEIASVYPGDVKWTEAAGRHVFDVPEPK